MAHLAALYQAHGIEPAFYEGRDLRCQVCFAANGKEKQLWSGSVESHINMVAIRFSTAIWLPKSLAMRAPLQWLAVHRAPPVQPPRRRQAPPA